MGPIDSMYPIHRPYLLFEQLPHAPALRLASNSPATAGDPLQRAFSPMNARTSLSTGRRCGATGENATITCAWSAEA